MKKDQLQNNSDSYVEERLSGTSPLPEPMIKVKNQDQIQNLAVSQINLDASVAEAARKASAPLRESPDPGDREFASKVFSETTADLYRLLCPFAAVATTINVLEDAKVIDSGNIARAVGLALENHRAPVAKDPHPEDRYFFGEWWACNKLGFFHQAALPLALAYGYNMVSVQFDRLKGLEDLFQKISQNQEIGLCISVENRSYLKNRHGDLMSIKDGNMFYNLRTPNGLAPIKLVPDSHLISLFNCGDRLLAADSFDIPTDENFDSVLAYFADQKTLEESVTGKALILSKAPILYQGKTIEMRLPKRLIDSLDEIKTRTRF